MPRARTIFHRTAGENLKAQLKRRLMILLVTVFFVGGFSVLLNRISYDANFSVIDAISGATKQTRREKDKTNTTETWSYSVDALSLPNETAYIEETIHTETGSYVLLRKADLSENTLVMLSDSENKDYSKAVQEIAAEYESRNYKVEIRSCHETMMLSLAHAEHFDLFLLREEAAS